MRRFVSARSGSFVVVAWIGVLFALVGSLAFAAAGRLDPTFGVGGKVTTDFTSGYDIADGVAVQADGKMVVVGMAGGRNPKFALARYNADGSLDTSFGLDGHVTTDFTSGFDGAAAVALQVNDQIVAAGEAGGRNPKFALARYNPDGSLDTSFGQGGKVTTNFTRYEDGAHAVAIQRDGKIVAAGMTGGGGDPEFALARYNVDGSLDTSFGKEGRVVTDFTSYEDRVFFGLAIQRNGKIVAAGVAGAGSPDSKFALARYNRNGSLDTSFGTRGRVTTDFTSNADSAFGLGIQTNGKIVIAGESGGGGANPRFALARYNTNGSLDKCFGGDGMVTTDFSAYEDGASNQAVQRNGKIVAAGVAGYQGPDPKFALTRYDRDGSLDPSFGRDGKVTTDFTPQADYADGLTIQADGKIVAEGVAGEGGSNPKFAVARYR